MTGARFSIGIDLGTTNSAMAFVPLDGAARSEVFVVPQMANATGLVEAATLPSFLYLADEALAAAIGAHGTDMGPWVVGRLARKRSAEAPGRVVRSAKSWLCHHAVDRRSPFLPWGSDEIAAESKISPVDASALILNYFRGAWNARFAAAGADFAFDSQSITVTVPASFDAAAQRLTLTAAVEAGFPEGVRLLEEPQAAFYRWLEEHDAARDLWDRLPDHASPSSAGRARHVLVVDIGGGTSDFSLFAVRAGAVDGAPVIDRIAVSDHLLLGGDNIDLALAHAVEPRLVEVAGGLSGVEWDALVAQCRELKENVLSRTGPPGEALTLSIAGRGSSVVAGARSARITRAEIEAVLFDGFFPECAADEGPLKRTVALKEWGLPFAADSAVTRHLAAFLRDLPAVDAVLYNGGSLYHEALRRRLSQLIGAWGDGVEPLVLANPDPDLAVACGAARYGKILNLKAERIEAGAGRAVFLAVHRPAPDDGGKTGRRLICVLPRGAAPEASYESEQPGLALRLDRPVRFQPYSSTHFGGINAGDIVPWRDEDFVPLPALETVARTEGSAGAETDRTVPIALSARLNELGLLQVACVSRDPGVAQTWPLEFNMRSGERQDVGAGAAPAQVAPNAEPAALEAAQGRIGAAFSQPQHKRHRLSAARLLKSLEDILGLPKSEWNWVLVRSLWPALEHCLADRARSIEHEEAWLILAGFLLRPGTGAPLDDARIDGLWQLRRAGLAFPSKRTRLQEYILWRRVAGGLSRERQERILAPELDRLLRQPAAPPELVRLAGALERLPVTTRTQLAERFVAMASDLASGGQHCAPQLAALASLLNRAPLHAGPESVVSARLVESAYEAFEKLDWTHPELTELQTLFLRAARVVDNRKLDLAPRLRERIARKLEKSGVSSQKTAKLRYYAPLQISERLGLYGEALPPGLILSHGSAA